MMQKGSTVCIKRDESKLLYFKNEEVVLKSNIRSISCDNLEEETPFSFKQEMKKKKEKKDHISSIE
jgi:hypothetical protein